MLKLIKKIWNRWGRRIRDYRRKLKLTKVVWKTYDWDSAYFYELIGQKLRNVLDYQLVDCYAEYPEAYISKLNIAIKLCDHLSGKENYPEHINTNNVKKYDPHNVIYEPRGEGEIHSSILDKLFPDSHYTCNFKRLYEEEVYNAKAKTILYEFLNDYLQYYGD